MVSLADKVASHKYQSQEHQSIDANSDLDCFAFELSNVYCLGQLVALNSRYCNFFLRHLFELFDSQYSQHNEETRNSELDNPEQEAT